MGDGLQQGYVALKLALAHPIVEPPPPTLNGTDIDIIRALVKTAVDKALHPEQDGTINPYRHRRIRQIDEDGTEWHGLLYPVDVNATDPMVQAVRESVPTGICWACKRPGESLVMAWYGTHLIHNTEECRELAGRTPETREHRG